MVEIALQFFIYAIEDLACWLEVLPQIQFVLYNISSSTIKKTLNEIAYGFSLKGPLDLVLAMTISKIGVAHTNAADTILFIHLN